MSRRLATQLGYPLLGLVLILAAWALACWLGIAVLLVWAAVFLNHTAVHPYFMARLLVIPVIGAVMLIMSRAMKADVLAHVA